MRRIILSFLALVFACACTPQQNTVVAVPGVPMLTIAPFTAPAKALATEKSEGVYAVNSGPTTVPPGAIIVVLKTLPPYTLTTQPSN